MSQLKARLHATHPDLEPQALEAALKVVTEEAWGLIQDRCCKLRRDPNEGELARLDELRMLASRVFEIGQEEYLTPPVYKIR